MHVEAEGCVRRHGERRRPRVRAIKDAEVWLSGRAKKDIDRLGSAKHQGLMWEWHEGVALKGFPGKFTLWAVK